MKQEIIQIITAGIGTLGFSIYFRVSKRNVVASTLGGSLGWIVYLIIFHTFNSLFFANFIAAFVVYVYSEIMARILKSPVNIFLVTGIIPLIPGGSLYYTMAALLEKDGEMFKSKGVDTALVTVGLAVGIVVSAIISRTIVSKIEEKRQTKKIVDTNYEIKK